MCGNVAAMGWCEGSASHHQDDAEGANDGGSSEAASCPSLLALVHLRHLVFAIIHAQ